MSRVARIVLSFALICITFQVRGQLFDTTEYRSDKATYIHERSLHNFDFKLKTEDTVMRFLHTFEQHMDQAVVFYNTGRFASPQYFVEPVIEVTSTFQMAPNVLGYLFHRHDSVRYYFSQTPRTYLSYRQGDGNLLAIEAQHAQNISKFWSFGIDYKRFKTQNVHYGGYPLFDEERMTNLFSTNLFSRFHTKNNKYEALLSVSSSKNTLLETFGVSNRQLYDLYFGRSRNFSATPYIDYATNTHVKRDIQLTQFWRPGKREVHINDSTIGPDTSFDNINKQYYWRTSYRREIFEYSDKNVNVELFPTQRHGLETFDSNFCAVLSNEFGYDVKRHKNETTQYFIQHEAIQARQWNDHRSNLSHVQVGVRKQLTLQSSQLLNIQGFFAPIGFYQGDYNLKANVQNIKKEKASWCINASVNAHRPAYNMQFWGSNYYYWNQRMNKTVSQSVVATLGVIKNRIRISGHLNRIAGMTYFDTTSTPQQINDYTNYAKLVLQSSNKLVRVLSLEQRICYQHISDERIRIPEWSYTGRVYREGNLFKKNMWMRAGVDLSYTSAFSAVTYNPAIRNFTWASGQIGGFPVLDIFLNAQVKTMTLSAAIKHVTQSYFANDGYSLKDYPLIGQQFHFGVNWRLYD